MTPTKGWVLQESTLAAPNQTGDAGEMSSGASFGSQVVAGNARSAPQISCGLVCGMKVSSFAFWSKAKDDDERADYGAFE